MTNHGLEISLNFHKQWTKDLFTSAYANFTYAKNRVDEYDEPASRIGTYRAQTGRSRNELLGLTAERLFLPEDLMQMATYSLASQDKMVWVEPISNQVILNIRI